MLATSNALRHLVSRTYLAGSKELTGSMLRGCSGARDFSRVIVVSALGRNNGITSGARLQWAALRQLGVEAELLDATPRCVTPCSGFHTIRAQPTSFKQTGRNPPHCSQRYASAMIWLCWIHRRFCRWPMRWC